MELKRIGVLSLGKISGLLGLIWGIISVILIAILQKLMANLPVEELGIQTTILTWQIALYIIVLYTIIGFISGLILALIYNLLAKLIGGIKLEFKEEARKK